MSSVPATLLLTAAGALAAVSTASGCSATPSEQGAVPVTSVATAGPTTKEPTAKESSTRGNAVPSATTGQLVYFSVEGGYANLGRSLTLASDGTSLVTQSNREQTGHLAKAELARIVQALDESGLFSADHEYAPAGGADLQRYEFGYRGHTVVAHDTTLPESLRPALRLLEEALRSGSSPA